MSQSAIVRHRVVFAWADEHGPLLVEFYVRGAPGGPWEVFVGQGAANARAKSIETLGAADQAALERAELKLAVPADDEPLGFTPKVLMIRDLVALGNLGYIPITADGVVALDSLCDLQRAAEIARSLSNEEAPGIVQP